MIDLSSLLYSFGVGAVSPEGLLRYWRGLTEDKPHSEVTLNTGNEHMHSLVNLEVRTNTHSLTHCCISSCRVVMGLLLWQQVARHTLLECLESQWDTCNLTTITRLTLTTGSHSSAAAAVITRRPIRTGSENVIIIFWWSNNSKSMNMV